MPPFTDIKLFPPLRDLPIIGEASDVLSSRRWYMLAQVKENMTITRPTLVAIDREGVAFAITFEDQDVDLKRFRRGYTIVLPNVSKIQREGKQDLLKVELEQSRDVKSIPTTLDRAFEIGDVLDHVKARQQCAACGKTGDGLMKCTGCGCVKYCSKDCQVRGWIAFDHKTECKAFKAIEDIWP